jgi:hypothetical protein
MPAIVLMNPHHATDLLKLLDKTNEHSEAHFWRQRSFVYIIGIINAYIRLDYRILIIIQLLSHFYFIDRRKRILLQT